MKQRRNYPQSEDRPYPSPYGDGFVDGAEYITQILLSREISHNGDLVEKFFWDNLFYAKKMSSYKKRVKELLTLFSVEDIMRAYNRPDMKKIWSPSWPKIHSIIRNEMAKKEQEDKIVPPEINTEKVPTTRQVRYGKSSLLNKLR